MSGALIVTAELGTADAARLTAERRAHYPPERNQLDAHLTMFHALPPSAEAESLDLLKRLAGDCRPPRVRLSDIISLGSGVAYKVESPELREIRELVADHFHGMLTAQDDSGWRPHITIQNKVSPKEAKKLLAEMRDVFEPRALEISGLGLHRYLGGPWEEIRTYRFRGLDIA